MKRPGFLLLMLCLAAVVAGLVFFAMTNQPKTSVRSKLVQYEIGAAVFKEGVDE